LRQIVQGNVARIVMIAAAAIFFAMAIPFPYRIGCDVEIQPVLRRFVAAPYEGIMEKSLVRNGDLVQAGQIVAQMDGRQLRIELAGLEAELQGTSKRRSAAMASGEIAEAQIALNEMKTLQAKIDLTNEKLKGLEIRSPIDGVVVAGELEKVEGAPVEMGQSLYEIGPLEQMLAEIGVPEEEIPYVRAGMPVKIKLTAHPFETWNGTILRIHPKSELRDGNSVFVAEVELDNPRLQLKPGMKGRAKVRSNWYPLGWNLFHWPMERIRYWTIW
jgi:RND family efflux transporter MFP subunit